MAIMQHYKDVSRESHVVFDWDNTLKIINRETKKIECSVTREFLHNLVTKKGCSLYIISAIRPSRMNMETLLMEVDKLGLREIFCPHWQSEQHAHSSALSKPREVEPCPSGCELSVPSCSHSTQVQQVQGSITYVHWGNIVICGYDKAEVFLKLLAEQTSDQRHSGCAIQCGSQSKGSHSIKTEGQEQSIPVDKFPENLGAMKHYANVRTSQYEYDSEDMVDGLDLDVDETDAFGPSTSQQRAVVFFDDEEVNIHNFASIVKNSKCIWVH